MKKLLLLVFAVLMLVTGMCQASAGLFDHPTVAIMPFENKGIVSKQWNREDMEVVNGYVYDDMKDLNMFQILERESMRSLTDEIAFQHTGLLDMSSAVQVGKMKGAQYLLIGSIMGVTARESQTTVVGSGTNRYKVTAVVSMRLVNVETSEVVLASVGRGIAKNTVVKAPLNIIRIGTAELDDTQVLDALQSAVDDAVTGPRGLKAKMFGKTGKRK